MKPKIAIVVGVVIWAVLFALVWSTPAALVPPATQAILLILAGVAALMLVLVFFEIRGDL